MRLFGSFTKVDERADGTLFISGIASSESVDATGEIVKADAMKAAMPDFMKFGSGNLREMHQLIAAGTIDKCDVNDDGTTYIECVVVDPVAIKKVQAGVYKGFSVGGKVTGRDKLNKSLITGVRLNEISLVDRPCNPDAVISLYKIDNLEDEPVQKTVTAPTAVEQAAINAVAALLDKGTITAGNLLKAAQSVGLVEAHEALLKVIGDAGCAEGTIAVDFVKSVVTERDTLKTQIAELQAAAAVQPAKLAGEALQKGMYGLRTFAELLQSAAYLAQDAEWEAQVEGDKSKIPAKLREWLVAGGQIFAAMTKEEIGELVATTAPAAAIVAADQGGDLTKVADLAKALRETYPVIDDAGPITKAQREMIHSAAEILEKAIAPAPVVTDSPVTAPVVEDPLAKLAAAEASFADELKKRDEQLAKAVGSIDALTKRLEAIEKQPMPGRALLKAIGKGDDLGTGAEPPKVDPVLKADGTVDEAATLVKATHANPIALNF